MNEMTTTIYGYSVYPNDDGDIAITQPIAGTDDAVIVIAPCQIEHFILALRDVIKELNSQEERDAS
jgi:hypothetical protein